MALYNRRPAISVFHGLSLRWMLILLSCCMSYGTKTDFACLQEVRSSLEDPNGYLSNWNFTNTTEGSICRFLGIECWHPEESRVLNIKLGDMGLRGQFPLGLVNCSSLTGLYLNGNHLNGSLPENISAVIKYVTELDLSDNDFSGDIPRNLSDCIYLNILNLDNNRFSGQIPLELGDLDRLKAFNVANNNLSGQVPHFKKAIVTKDDFANNSGLCGAPVFDPCVGPPKKSHSHLACHVWGVTACFSFVVAVAAFVYKSKKKDAKKEVDDPGVDGWLLSTKGTKAIKVSMFDKTVPKLTWGDIMKATDNFSINNIIGSEMTGTMYKATLLDGALLMVKRLQNSHQTKTEFEAEVTALGSLKHPNLVPLLGFCIIKKERFLVYKYMPNGNLYDRLHPADDAEPSVLGWPLRLRIAIRIANVLMWLEQNRIHGKVSSKSILLDHDFEPRLYELGLARIMNLSQAQFSSFARGQIGDLGFVVPEYSNVHAFGTVLLELITGQKPFQMNNASENFKGSLLEWVHQLSRTSSDDLYSVIDKSLLEEGSTDELFQFLSVACSCVSSVPKERPTMCRVYGLLKAIGEGHNFSENMGMVTFEVTCE